MGSPRFETSQLPGYHLVRAWFPPGAALERHAHDRTNIMVMLRGSFVLGIRGREIDCTRATVAIEPLGEPHHNQVGNAGAEVIVIQPDPVNRQAWHPFGHMMSTLRHGRSREAQETARRLCREMRSNDDITRLAREALTVELMVHAMRLAPLDGSQRPAWLGRVEALLRDSSQLPTLEAIANEVGHHPVHVSRVFRRHHGTSIGSWARQVRLERAAERLMVTEDPIAMIAASLGYCDQSHFTREFRRHFGRTPAHYRRQGAIGP